MSARATYWVARRELHEMLRAPLVYGIGGLFLVVQGIAFAGLVGSLSDPRAAPPLGALVEGQLAGTLLTWVLQLVVLTLLGMRAIADDKRSGAWELLLTAQVSEGAAVVGKWLAASVVYALLWIPTLVYFVVVALFRSDSGGWDWASIACGYLGAIAIGCALLAWTIAASAATRSTLAAGGLGFGILMAMFLVGEVASVSPDLAVDHPTLASILGAVSMRNAVLGFARGELGLPGLALIAGIAVTGLSLAIALAGAGRRRTTRARLVSTVGLGIVAILVGALAARHPKRLDVSGEHRNTLDPATYEVLATLPGATTITIVQPTLGGLEPIYDEVARVANRMAETAPISVRVVDPLSAPGGIDAIAKSAGIARADLAQSGSVVVDLAGKRRVVDLLSLATLEQDMAGSPRVEQLAIEQALTATLAGLTQISGRELVACATTGHGEFPLTHPMSGSDWTAVADRLHAEGFATEDVAIEVEVPARCGVLIVAGPSTPLSAREALAIQAHVRAGRGLVVAAAGRSLPGSPATGLEAVLSDEALGLPAAITVDPPATVREVPGALLVIDGYASQSAAAATINAGFARARATLWFQPRAVIAGTGAQPLVSASSASWGERDLITAPPVKDPDDLGGPIVLAAAGRHAARATAPTRVVAIGSAESFTTAFAGGAGGANELWIARVVRWAANAPEPPVDIAARIPTQVRLVLTSSERNAIVALSIGGIPLAWLVLGGLILYVRHQRARRAAAPAPDQAPRKGKAS